MRYRVLGGTGLRVSEIGFGAWGIGGTEKGSVAYGPADRSESLRALARAQERGVTFFDTSDLYGFGRSEELIGEAFAGTREKVVIATKVGMLDSAGAHDFSAAHIRKALHASLVRLRTDYVDLYQLHSPPLSLLQRDEGPLAELERLQRDGLVRAIGVSVRAPQDGVTMVHELQVSCLQVNFSMVDQRARECGLLDLCRSRGVGVIVRTPLCFGFLSGQYQSDSHFEATDHRNRWPAAQIARWAEASSVFDPAFASSAGQTAAQKALRFCLSEPAVCTAIPGMMSVAHVDENAAASDLGALRSAEITAIHGIYEQHSFFEAPAAASR
jgi:aryl-alcohol dehydrogenase-like predicted oxidoreductase